MAISHPLHTPFTLQFSSNSDILSVDTTRASVQGIRPGTAQVQLNLAVGRDILSDTITVMDFTVQIRKLDPVVSSLRLTSSSLLSSRLSSGSVTLELLSSLFYQGEAVEITASAILEDGRRIIITDPDELRIQTSDNSVVSVSGNYIIANNSGVANLTVMWWVCDMVITSSMIEVTVTIDEFRPMFDPDNQTAEVPEDSERGYLITTVIATDPDHSVSDVSRFDIQYRIKSPDPYNGLFVVDAVSGEVTLNGALDRETLDQYELLIEATDRRQRVAEESGVVCEGAAMFSGSASGSGDVLEPESPIVCNQTLDAEPPAVLEVSSKSILISKPDSSLWENNLMLSMCI